MIASHPDPYASRRSGPLHLFAVVWALVLACAFGAGCTSSARAPMGPSLIERGHPLAKLPEPEEVMARELAAAALAGDSQAADRALRSLEGVEAQRESHDLESTGLVAIATEVRVAMDAKGTGFHDEARNLLDRDDLGIVQKRRLEHEVAGDPLSRADRQVGNARKRRVAGAANSLVAPVGRSLSAGSMLPLRLLQALVGVGLREHERDELSNEERLALREWKRFVELKPDDPRALLLLAKIENAQRRWYETQRTENLALAKEAMEKGKARMAVLLAERTLRYAPEDPAASELLYEAEAAAKKLRAARARSLEAPGELSAAKLSKTRHLAWALLGGGDVEREAKRLADQDRELADEADFAAAIAMGERGAETEMWDLLRELGERDDRKSNMARHARTIWISPDQHPYGAFRSALRKQRGERTRWLFFGHLASGPRDRDLPRALEWAVEIPSLPGVVGNFPGRLVQFPWARPTRRSPSVFARRYLARNPGGAHEAEVGEWLESFEEGRGNFVAAAKIAEQRGMPEIELLALRQRAGKQAFEAATKQADPGLRRGLLERVAKEFADTQGGEEAGRALREEAEAIAPQHIRVSKAFLVEHPDVSGPRGLGLREDAIDGDLDNAELHPQGIELLDNRVIELAYLAESGKADDEPILRRERVSAERMSRLVAMIDEASMRQALVDPDVPMEHDANRDVFFERARLGLSSGPARPETESTYTFQGANERYGMVRARDSILPVELVLQGSIRDLGLGAFPRFKLPRRDPDAILYR